MPKAKTRTDDIDQAEMFPELDTDNAKHKKLISAARKLHRVGTERNELLRTSKQKYDDAMEEAVAQMKANEFERVKSNGMVIELVHGKDKAEVTVRKIEPAVEAEDD